MRGAQRTTLDYTSQKRIIPADAGSTSVLIFQRPMSQDHPRGCGEHSAEIGVFPSSPGSSPRMRGAQYQCRFDQILCRIIPADAGSTYGRARPWCRYRDHPRGCGEHLSWGRKVYPAMGSSPRMRGARPGVVAALVAGGIIPADAGSTWRWSHCRPAGQDHPRGCGEHADAAHGMNLHCGSSPRMRGAPVDDGVNLVVHGIIPADAGSTDCWRCAVCR